MCINRRINEKFKVNIKCRLLWSALILIILSIVLFPLFPHLVLSYEDDIVWFKPIMRDEKFTIKYTHSVNKSPVEDSIKWNGNKLIICDHCINPMVQEFPMSLKMAKLLSGRRRVFYFQILTLREIQLICLLVQLQIII